MSDANNRRYPESTFEAEYPYNQSTITRSGHEIHINDTPDKESLRIAHTKGSYVEIDKDGRTVVNSVGKGYYYFCDGFTTTVDGHHDLKVRGVMNVNIDGSVSEQTGGNRYMAAGGDFVLGVNGTLSQTVVADKYEAIGGDETVGITGAEYKSVGSESVTYVTGVKTEILGNDWAVTSGGNIEILSDGSVRIKCKNFIIDAETITFNCPGGAFTVSAQSLSAAIEASSNITSGGDVNVSSSGSTTIQSGTVDINGSPVKINGVVQIGN
jgi:hypothetical protein